MIAVLIVEDDLFAVQTSVNFSIAATVSFRIKARLSEVQANADKQYLPLHADLQTGTPVQSHEHL